MASAIPGGAPGYDDDKQFGNNITHNAVQTSQRLRGYSCQRPEVKGRRTAARSGQLSGVFWPRRERKCGVLPCARIASLMVRRRSCAVSNHEARGPSFETPAAQAPQDEEFLNAANGPPHAEERRRARLEARTAPLPRGRNGRSRARRGRTGRTRRRSCTPNGGRRGLRGRRRSTLRSRPRPSSNISTTNPTPTIRALASRGRLRSRACRRTG
jgi:hypothetical protein